MTLSNVLDTHTEQSIARDGCDFTYVVLLNWNSWQDTIACLESVFASEDASLKVIVCDNASTDHSLDKIGEWARGRRHVGRPGNQRMAKLVSRGRRRPRWAHLTRHQADTADASPDIELILIDTEENRGFAAGNNVGIRYALRQPDMSSIWLLNNDTLVEPDCLAAMRQVMSTNGHQVICGSVIHFYDQPDVIQAVGGNSFDYHTGIASQSLGRDLPESSCPDPAEFIDQLDYLSGCSILFPRRALEDVGLLNESYFLYYEEIDWFTRNRGRYPMVIAQNAHLYHREGSAIGSPTAGRRPSPLSDKHIFRSRIRYMKNHQPERMGTVYRGVIRELLKRLLVGQVRSIPTIVRAVWGARPVVN